MPTEYSIEPDRSLVRSRAWGLLTEEESFSHYQRLSSDPLFQPTFQHLCDLSDVEKMDIGTAAIRSLARASVFAPGVRRAFVAPVDAHYGLSRMLQAFSEFEGSRIGVFRTMGEAEEWLELD